MNKEKEMKKLQAVLLLSILSAGLSCPSLASEGIRGERTLNYSQAEVIRLTLQEFMTTTVLLPSDEKITEINIGNSDAFETSQKSDHVFLIKPKGLPGSESSITVHGGNGHVYTFYVRSENFNSKTTPDLKVVVHGTVDSPRSASNSLS
jgi:hypothetical protein